MKSTIMKTIKFTAGVCAALGVVTIGAVVASGTAVKVVAEGLKAGAEAMKKAMEELRTEQCNETKVEVVDTTPDDDPEMADNNTLANNDTKGDM